MNEDSEPCPCNGCPHAVGACSAEARQPQVCPSFRQHVYSTRVELWRALPRVPDMRLDDWLNQLIARDLQEDGKPNLSSLSVASRIEAVKDALRAMPTSAPTLVALAARLGVSAVWLTQYRKRDSELDALTRERIKYASNVPLLAALGRLRAAGRRFHFVHEVAAALHVDVAHLHQVARQDAHVHRGLQAALHDSSR